MAQLQLKILTMEGVKFEGAVDSISVPGADGLLTILPSHAALLTALQQGEATIRADGGERYISILGGIMDVSDDRVSILADAAEMDSDIDIARAEAAVERAQQQAASVQSSKETEEALRALTRARVRVKVARHRKNRGGGQPSSGGLAG